MTKLTLMPRRKFVQGALTSAAAASAAVASGIVVVGCGNDVTPAPFIDAQVVDDKTSPDYGTVTLDLRRYPDIQPIGGAITVRLQALAPDPSRTYAVTDAILLVHLAETSTSDTPSHVAMDSACPHAACPLGYSIKDGLVECPCHGSQFQPVPQVGACTVEVVHLPSVQGPRVYGVRVLGDTLIIDLKGPGGGTPKGTVSGGKLTLNVADFPMLAQPGGSQVFMCGEIAGYGGPIVVVRQDQSTFVALNATCTHQACSVAYTPGPNDLECPCHGSRFGLDGGVLKGPATRPLTAFTTSFDGTKLTITVA